SLKWCGIEPDEGVGKGGEYAPYRQSERREIYREYAERLVHTGYAYYAFDTPDELDALRNEYEAKKETFTYDASVRNQLRNSINLSNNEVEQLIAEGHPYVVRFKFSDNQEIVMHDEIRGTVRMLTSTLDDKVLFKSDGMPTYHLANVVDDYLMKITHVIRGEEWLPSLPLHVSLYRAFGWEENMPRFAHLPLILKPDGKGKLSKRDGDKGGFPVFPLEWKDPETGEIAAGYRESGYFPEACLNLLALLGWNPGSEQEIFNLSELIYAFDLERVTKAGARFDPAKARWFNHQYMQMKDVQTIAQEFFTVLKEKGVDAELRVVEKVVGLVRERVDFVADLWEQSWFFFHAPESYDEKVVKKRWNEQTSALLNGLAEVLESCEPFVAPVIEEKVKSWIEQNQHNPGAVMNAWRLCLVGTSMGPGLFDMAEVLGKEETLRRIRSAFRILR
ncbi:MAG: glutamate--tRNA ligase, partial [Bacteroidales bacterium]|nr:glutamate--tRNA ligase [Bacteroidales bacterium]